MEFENEIKLGNGIYTVSEISRILRIPYSKVHFWLVRYWDGELGRAFENKYSWSLDNTKAVSFHTLIEFYILIQLAEVGVKTREVLKAHIELSKAFKTAFPFAQKEILERIHTDGYKIYFDIDGNTILLDGTKQLNLKFIKDFYKNLDFGDNSLASRYWPLGKDKSVVIDPKRQFGHPVIGNTNIFPETIYNLYKAGEPVKFIAFTYELENKAVEDAIEYCKAA